jgi:hypothetical protein
VAGPGALRVGLRACRSSLRPGLRFELHVRLRGGLGGDSAAMGQSLRAVPAAGRRLARSAKARCRGMRRPLRGKGARCGHRDGQLRPGLPGPAASWLAAGAAAGERRGSAGKARRAERFGHARRSLLCLGSVLWEREIRLPGEVERPGGLSGERPLQPKLVDGPLRPEGRNKAAGRPARLQAEHPRRACRRKAQPALAAIPGNIRGSRPSGFGLHRPLEGHQNELEGRREASGPRAS